MISAAAYARRTKMQFRRNIRRHYAGASTITASRDASTGSCVRVNLSLTKKMTLLRRGNGKDCTVQEVWDIRSVRRGTPWRSSRPIWAPAAHALGFSDTPALAHVPHSSIITDASTSGCRESTQTV